MGGHGSGWQWGRKCQVEECLILSAARLQSLGLLREGAPSGCGLNWSNDAGVDIGGGTWTLEVHVDRTPPQMSIMRPGAFWPMHSMFLTTTALPWGGVRWWFLCPHRNHLDEYGHKFGKLYFKPGTDVFACRRCHHLTYWSRQTSSRRDRLDRAAERLMSKFGSR